jgi:hypothetical protein
VRDEIEVPFQNFSFGIAHLVVDAFRKKIGLRLILTACFSAQKSIIRNSIDDHKNKKGLVLSLEKRYRCGCSIISRHN